MSVEVPYTKLGKSGLKISRVIVGCMSYGTKAWANWVIEDEEVIFGIFSKCYAAGIRTFDTADVYSNGKSEELLGKWIKQYNIPRDRIVILSKCYFPVDTNIPGFNLNTRGNFPKVDYINSQGLSRKHIFDAVEATVQRLGTYMDVLQVHRLDQDTPSEEIMKALHDVIGLGHTRYIGASTMKATEFAELQFVAEKNGWTKFISMQNYYNLLYREEEREMIPFCNRSEVGLIPWSPNARGILTRPASAQSDRTQSDRTMTLLGLDSLTEADSEILKRVEEVAKTKNVSMATIATTWVLSKGASPIVGLSSEARVDDILQAFTVTLDDKELEYLEAAYQPKRAI
ncbi:hypothetical protein BABINDRAFT_163293 [Babjeviella inositovora NRRL Y-12698]|uniref:NADP-dependent oxidoreductase domain-containing protein n=1 Tax=Babjeviella inositovora NRRL Y-12698 TaxID=984486 RepID=A0A1E3QJY8_9ASCO|nr:uncharacterized protein BABINDRAFT_163293 [Babjeviella inositovora NRRL Y-12698]ODQ77928.1 hypothetical protein BABINDRAFT_163293 [Babjeviella inositovora NRRL Y-12698]